MFTGDIRESSPFKDLFPIRENTLNEIVADMKKNGYDKSHPIAIWMGHRSIVLDGHTRLQAAKLANIHEVPIVLKEFPSEEEALNYTIKCQRSRRNLTECEILKCIMELDRKRDKNANLKQNRTGIQCGALGKSSHVTASLLGISSRKVEKARTILDKAPDAIKEAVKSGKMSINAAYNRTIDWIKGKSTPPVKPAIEKERVEELFELIKSLLSNEDIRKLIKLLMEEI